MPPGGSAGATIKGGGLSLPGLALEVRKNNGSSAEGKVTADLGRSSKATSRGLTVRAKKDAQPGKYKVTLKGPDTNISLPFLVEVDTPEIISRKVDSPAPSPGKSRDAPSSPEASGRSPSLPGPGSPRATAGVSPALEGIAPHPKKVEIISKGGKKVPLPLESPQVTDPGNFGAAVLTTQRKDLRCSIRATYDQEGTKPIDPIGPVMGNWHFGDSEYNRLLWTHVEVIYAGAKPEPTRQTPQRMVGPLKVSIRFKHKTQTWSGSAWKTKDFSNEPPIGPGESYVYAFYTLGPVMYSRQPLYISAKMDTTDVVEEPEGNNTCQYRVNFFDY